MPDLMHTLCACVLIQKWSGYVLYVLYLYIMYIMYIISGSFACSQSCFELVFELVLDLVHSENGHLLYLVTYFLPQSCF